MGVPEVSRDVVAGLAELDGEDLMHCGRLGEADERAGQDCKPYQVGVSDCTPSLPSASTTARKRPAFDSPPPVPMGNALQDLTIYALFLFFKLYSSLIPGTEHTFLDKGSANMWLLNIVIRGVMLFGNCPTTAAVIQAPIFSNIAPGGTAIAIT